MEQYVCGVSEFTSTTGPYLTALELLRGVDERLLSSGIRRLSLDDGRDQARGMRELGQCLLHQDRDAQLALPFAVMLRNLTEAQLTHFPENLFWDLDFLASSALDNARKAGDAGVETLEEYDRLLRDMYQRFGSRSPIRFRYVHDFTYGFDWAKWVRKNPAQRGRVGPFDLAFLRAMHQRGHELLELIDADDREYPALPEGRVRNPFGFKRDPDSEFELLRALARAGAIPVQTWKLETTPDWNRPFADIRTRRARQLGLGD